MAEKNDESTSILGIYDLLRSMENEDSGSSRQKDEPRRRNPSSTGSNSRNRLYDDRTYSHSRNHSSTTSRGQKRSWRNFRRGSNSARDNSDRDDYNRDESDCSPARSIGPSQNSPSKGRRRKKVKFVIAKKKIEKCDEDSASDDENVQYLPVGYKYLLEQCEKQAHEVVLEILTKNSRFEVFLNESELEADWLFLIVKILANVCESVFVGNKSEMLNKICRSKLLHSISFYLGEIQMETKEKTIANFKSFFIHLTAFLESVVSTLPKVAYEKDLTKIIKKTVKAVDEVNGKFSTGVEEGIAQTLNTLIEKIENYRDVVEGRVNPGTSANRVNRSEIAPPDDFRTISLYPRYDDLTRTTFNFLRPNKQRGAYLNVEHYLDVQFRLLREDYIDPLRRGLQKYTEAKKTSLNTGYKRMKMKFEGVRLYRRTKFQCQEVTSSSRVGYLLNFDPERRLTKIMWEYSKRFMFGSLLLFTTDDFQTFFYGTVLEHSLKRLKEGCVLVNLDATSPLMDGDLYDREFLMAESEVFFEPYFLVMKRLVKLNEKNFPMTRYIVFGERQTRMPAYLNKFAQWEILGFTLQPMQTENWPPPDGLGLDESQYEAFKTALTSDFSVIQGPPGTGKTYIGLKIMEVLLSNIRLNANAVRTPILVVCYTNHALDQFLEGVLQYTSKIVRAGSRSKSEVLSNYNLRGQNQFPIRNQVKSIRSTLFDIKERTEKSIMEIRKLILYKNEIDKPVGVLKYELISKSMPNDVKQIIKNDDDLLKWLLSVPEEEADQFSDSDSGEWTTVDQWSAKPERSAEEMEEVVEFEDDENTELVDESMSRVISLNLGTCYYRTIEGMRLELQEFIVQRNKLKTEMNACTDRGLYHKMRNQHWELKKHFDQKYIQFVELEQRLSNVHSSPENTAFVPNTKDVRRLKTNDRWQLYWNWVADVRRLITAKLNKEEENFREKMVQYDECKQIEDIYVVKQADVVGMTTTCAARLNIVLEEVKPAIVIVEEAAEVLEPHIVASLTNFCEHVILIGDHKQLKPSVSVYELCKKFKFDVSLFERMVNNGMHCPMLNIQHRMRPEISRLITPLIYPDLKNHESVLQYPSVKGVDSNIFFLEHNQFEQEVDDTSSRKNIFEVEFLLELCKYLLLQGYSSSDITILTTYTGQMFLFRERMRSSMLLQNVRCIVVDKYQGEENKIILLSLVRSNKEGKIGFLKTENRVCVALSRAKEGLFIVGNMDSLSAASPMWSEIKSILQKDNCIGRTMKLYCARHHEYTEVSSALDFDKVCEGGCNRICGDLMACGHKCESLCHALDSEHVEIKCRRDCERKCPRMHPCKLRCYQSCAQCRVVVEKSLPCGHEKKLCCFVDENTYKCDEIMEDIAPLCNHKVLRECWQKVEDVECQEPCEWRLPNCGHKCPSNCHKKRDPDHLDFKCKQKCARPNKDCSQDHMCQKLCFEVCGLCTVRVDKVLPCGHSRKLECCVDLNQVKCTERCRKPCPNCLMECRKKCFEPCQPCINKVKKTIPECGHAVFMRCSDPLIREYCTEPCKFDAPCGHKCKALCSEPCGSKQCNYDVNVSVMQLKCGHRSVRVPCYMQYKVHEIDKEVLSKYCNSPCNVTLECDHLCGGSCGPCWQKRFHKNCQTVCGNVLICGHSCKYPCRKFCPPCEEPCGYFCKHSRCQKKCGVPCIPCQEKCEWRCEHAKCTRKCGEMCNRKPCYEPCTKLLACGHECCGYCGEPCPDCRICKPEITEIFFGTEDEPDARFVYLEDCKHSVESTGLEQFLNMNSDANEKQSITMKVCPICKTPIMTTLRCQNYVKKVYESVLKIKKRVFGYDEALDEKRVQLTEEVKKLRKTSGNLCRVPVFNEFVTFLLENLPTRVQNRSNRNRGTAEIYSLCIIAENFLHLFAFFTTKYEAITKETVRDKLSIKLDRLFAAFREKSKFIKEWEREFFSVEMRRVQRYTHLFIVECCETFPVMKSSNSALYNEALQKLELHSYTASVDKEVESILNELSNLRCTIEEKKSILAAMAVELGSGIQQGHWYTCSCGYVYSVANCGMFNQASQCPSCRRGIGTSSGNTHVQGTFWANSTNTRQ